MAIRVKDLPAYAVPGAQVMADAPPRASRLTGALRFTLLGLQFGLALLLIRGYQLETRTFFDIVVLAAVGWVIHSALPRAYRLPFFAALSIAGLAVAFGWSGGATLFATGLMLIATCHLPMRWSYRVALLLVEGGVLALGRGNVIPLGWEGGLWAILGSMFMFRLALYMHAVKQEGYSFRLDRTLAYFFMLPNVAFPLYPVVDYTAFERNHYDDEDLDIYETGMLWVVRGLVQLVLYRVVYRFVVTDAGYVHNLSDLLRYLLGTFLLYLRVSGSFHLIAGMIRLFGFRLHETHHLYYLASGFTDFWRRINIYWKDFMMKLVYYPSFFRLRKGGKYRAMIQATILVFVGTWLLHSYQWFWLRGGFPLTAEDVLFWGLLGALVVRASMKEMRQPRKKTLAAEGWSASLALRTVGTFVVLCVLWSLWSTDSLIEWMWAWRAAAHVDTAGALLLGGLLVGGFLMAGRNWGAAGGEPNKGSWVRHPAVRSLATFAVLLGIAQTQSYEASAPRLAGIVASVKSSELNAQDAELRHRGYYEKLDNPGRMSAGLWASVAETPEGWNLPWKPVILHPTDDFVGWELVPNASSEWNGTPVHINRWGMHDRDIYTLEKPQGTLRIAFLGQSHVMGTFLREDEVFDNVLEDRLNAEAAGTGRRYELLNFGVTDYSLTQQYALMTKRVLGFHPDVVVLTAAPNGRDRVVRHLLRVGGAGVPLPPSLDSLMHRLSLDDLSAKGVAIPFQTLRNFAHDVGIEARIPWNEALARARFSADSLNNWALRESARAIRAAGATPVLMALPLVEDGGGELPEMKAAREAGFTVLNLLDVWNGRNQKDLYIAPWDTHPNAEGDSIIADRLYDELHKARLLAPRPLRLDQSPLSAEEPPWT